MKINQEIIRRYYDIAFLLFIFCVLSLQTFAARYSITGTFPQLSGQTIKLTGFEGLKTYVISTTTVSHAGTFTLSYAERDCGMGYLSASDNKPFIIVLAPEDLVMVGQSLSIPESVRINSGYQNQIFGRYAAEHPKREQALSAWRYLEKMYQQDDLFSVHKEACKAIANEKKTNCRRRSAVFIKITLTGLYFMVLADAKTGKFCFHGSAIQNR